METSWLEDFISLAETRSFSKSAQIRHVTQPAFSRRIQALESWAGTSLVDRSSYPTQLTSAGQTMHEQALEILQNLQNTRSMLKIHAGANDDMVSFAIPHTLAFTFFPIWVSKIQKLFKPFKSRLMALNVHDASMLLTENNCDFLITYYHNSQPLQLDSKKYEMVILGQEWLTPYVKSDSLGNPLFNLPGKEGKNLPFLAYSPVAYLARITDLILKQSNIPLYLDLVYETDMAEGLKMMALEGQGIAFLPYSAVKNEIKKGLLVKASDNPKFQLPMEVRAYRKKMKIKNENKNKLTNSLWNFLQAQAS